MNIDKALIIALRGPRPRPTGVQLSGMEVAVLMRLGKGQPIKDIAKAMFKSPSTISTYRLRILKKLNFTSNAQIAVLVHEMARQTEAA